MGTCDSALLVDAVADVRDGRDDAEGGANWTFVRLCGRGDWYCGAWLGEPRAMPIGISSVTMRWRALMAEVGVSGREVYPYFSNSRLRASAVAVVSSGGVGGRARLAK